MSLTRIGVAKRKGPQHVSTVQKAEQSGTSCSRCKYADGCPVYDPQNAYGFCRGFVEVAEERPVGQCSTCRKAEACFAVDECECEGWEGKA